MSAHERPWPPPGCPYLNRPGTYCPNCNCGARPTIQPASKVGWLIETKHIDGTPWWWNGKLYDDDDWTKNSLEALAFASKEDAEKIIRQIGWTTVVPTEHRWGT